MKERWNEFVGVKQQQRVAEMFLVDAIKETNMAFTQIYMKLLSVLVLSAFGVAEGNGEKDENEWEVQRGKAAGLWQQLSWHVGERRLTWQIQSRRASDLVTFRGT